MNLYTPSSIFATSDGHLVVGFFLRVRGDFSVAGYQIGLRVSGCETACAFFLLHVRVPLELAQCLAMMIGSESRAT